MRKLALLSALAAVAASFAAPQVAADPPEHFVFLDNVSFQSGRLTRACGTPVVITIFGTLRVTLRTDQNGVVHETDHFTKWALTYSAPATGRSFSIKFGTGFFEYPEGVFLGAPAIVTFTGVQHDVPGLPTEAGRVVFPAEIIAISPEGVPIIDAVGPPIFQSGNAIDPAVVTAALCKALTG